MQFQSAKMYFLFLSKQVKVGYVWLFQFFNCNFFPKCSEKKSYNWNPSYLGEFDNLELYIYIFVIAVLD